MGGERCLRQVRHFVAYRGWLRCTRLVQPFPFPFLCQFSGVVLTGQPISRNVTPAELLAGSLGEAPAGRPAGRPAEQGNLTRCTERLQNRGLLRSRTIANDILCMVSGWSCLRD